MRERKMKHERYFDDFLSNQVNLNKTRLDTLERHVNTISTMLRDKLNGYRKYSEQGSYAHKTIIKPVQDNDEFDADILVFIRSDDFNPYKFETDYVDEVYKLLIDSENYMDKTKRNTRCVTIDYTGDFHLDVVPCVDHNGTHYICNRKDERYEKTDGDGYKNWLISKNKIVGHNNFRKTTRLLKFLRDHKDNFSVKSILLTTMLGNQVSSSEKESNHFSDLPTALKALSSRLNDFLQSNEMMPTIDNPVMPAENFNRHWDQKKYSNFRDKFDIYAKKINEAFGEKDNDESVKKWRKLFGDKFGKLKDSESGNKTSGTLGGGAMSVGVIPTVPAKSPYAYDD